MGTGWTFTTRVLPVPSAGVNGLPVQLLNLEQAASPVIDSVPALSAPLTDYTVPKTWIKRNKISPTEQHPRLNLSIHPKDFKCSLWLLIQVSLGVVSGLQPNELPKMAILSSLAKKHAMLPKGLLMDRQAFFYEANLLLLTIY